MLGTPAIVGHLLAPARRRSSPSCRARAEALRAAREEEAAAAVAEERARVAIGVHDALAHRVGEMSLHAAGAAAGRRRRPRPRARRARADRGRPAAPRSTTSARWSASCAPDDPLAPRAARRARPRRCPGAWSPGRRAGRRRREPARRAPRRGAARRRRDRRRAVRRDHDRDAGLAQARGPRSRSTCSASPAISAPIAFRRRAPARRGRRDLAGVRAAGAVLTSPGVLVTTIVLLLLPPYTVAAHLPLRGALAGLAVCVAASLVLEPSVHDRRPRPARVRRRAGSSATARGASAELDARHRRARAHARRARRPRRAARSACGSRASCTTRSRTA